MKYPYKQETQYPSSKKIQKHRKMENDYSLTMFSNTVLCPSHSYSPRLAMPAAASDDNDAIRTGEHDEAVEGVDDGAWDVFDYFGEL